MNSSLERIGTSCLEIIFTFTSWSDHFRLMRVNRHIQSVLQSPHSWHTFRVENKNLNASAPHVPQDIMKCIQFSISKQPRALEFRQMLLELVAYVTVPCGLSDPKCFKRLQRLHIEDSGFMETETLPSLFSLTPNLKDVKFVLINIHAGSLKHFETLRHLERIEMWYLTSPLRLHPDVRNTLRTLILHRCPDPNTILAQLRGCQSITTLKLSSVADLDMTSASLISSMSNLAVITLDDCPIRRPVGRDAIKYANINNSFFEKITSTLRSLRLVRMLRGVD
jgi:ribosomal protein L30/L7E